MMIPCWLSPVLLIAQFSACPGPDVPFPKVQNDRGPQRLTIGVGRRPGAVAIGDIDGDGDPDLVVANSGSGDVMVLVLAADGRRATVRSRTDAGHNPVDLALADLDEDGDLDVAIANHDTDYLTLLLGDGTGRMLPAANSPLRLGIEPHPHAVLTADIDRDGHVDLLVDERDREAVRALHGRGDGSFDTVGFRIPVGGDPYRGMALGDLNGDGWLDLVTPNPTAAAVLLAGEEGFGLPRPLPARRPFAVALADLNGDGAVDLLSTSEAGHLEVFYGDGVGGFGAADQQPRLPSGGKKAVAGDFDGDGNDDVAIVNWMAEEVVLLMGSRHGTSLVRVPAGKNPWGLAAADLNGDGCDDLAVANEGDDELLVLLSRRAGAVCQVR